MEKQTISFYDAVGNNFSECDTIALAESFQKILHEHGFSKGRLAEILPEGSLRKEAAGLLLPMGIRHEEAGMLVQSFSKICPGIRIQLAYEDPEKGKASCEAFQDGKPVMSMDLGQEALSGKNREIRTCAKGILHKLQSFEDAVSKLAADAFAKDYRNADAEKAVKHVLEAGSPFADVYPPFIREKAPAIFRDHAREDATSLVIEGVQDTMKKMGKAEEAGGREGAFAKGAIQALLTQTPPEDLLGRAYQKQLQHADLMGIREAQKKDPSLTRNDVAELILKFSAYTACFTKGKASPEYITEIQKKAGLARPASR